MAISGQLTVTPEELGTQAGVVRETTKNLAAKFDRLKQLVIETENFWIGEAAEEHRSNYQKNQTSIEEIIARYNEHVRDLEAMAGIYHEAEVSATNLADELPAITI